MTSPTRCNSSPLNLWRPGPWTKVLAAGIGGLFAILSFTRPDGYGWVGAILMSAAAVTVPTLQFRALWNRGRFWATVLIVAIMQIPLVFAVHHLVDQLRASFLLGLGVADGLCVIAVIFYACVNKGDSCS